MINDTLTSLIAGLQGECGIAIINLNSREIIFEHNANTAFISASCIKTAILVELFDRVNSGELDPKAPITISDDDFVGGSGIMEMLSVPREYTLDDCALLMIIVSDNVATNKLIDLLSIDAVNAKMKQIGMHNSILARKMMDFEARKQGRENLMSPNDAIQLYDHIYQHRDRYSRLLNILLSQQLKGNLPHLVDSSIQFAHKTGSLDGVLNDTGIFFFSEPIAVAVMIQNLEKAMDGKIFQNKVGKAIADFFM